MTVSIGRQAPYIGCMKIKYTNSLVRRAFILLTAAALAGCAQQVQVMGNWTEGESRQQSFSRMLVVGISHDVNGRCEFEGFLTSQLRTTGVEAKSSCSLMKTSEPLTVEAVDAAVQAFDADAVIATILVSSQSAAMVGGKDDTRGGLDFKATGTGFAPTYYYGGYGRYGVPVVYGRFVEAPVVTTLSGEATIQSKVYSTSSESMVYEVVTTANDLSSIDNALSIIVPPITNQLQQAGLLAGS